MLVNLSYSFIHLQKDLQKGIDRPVENPQKRVENLTEGAERDKPIGLTHAQTKCLSAILKVLPLFASLFPVYRSFICFESQLTRLFPFHSRIKVVKIQHCFPQWRPSLKIFPVAANVTQFKAYKEEAIMKLLKLLKLFAILKRANWRCAMSNHIFRGNILISNRRRALFVVLSLSLIYGIICGFVRISSNCLVPREVNYDPLTPVRNEAGTYDLLPAVPNVVKSSCLRNAFSDIVLVILYNFPFYSSIPTLSGLYKNAFPTIMFCGEKESKEHNVEWVGHIFRGYFGYACMSRAMQKYPAHEGYLLISDDVILNYWNLIEMDRNKIWEGPKVPILSEYTPPEKWSWWNSIYGKNSCQKAYEEIWILYNSSTTETLSNMSSLAVNGTVHSRGVLGDIKGSIDLSKQNRNWTFLCPRRRSDIFYLPRKFADEFKTLSDIFYKYRTFLEIAVPAMYRIIDKEDNFEYIPGIYLPGVGDKQSDFLWKTYNTTLAFIHPFKLGYEHDGALNKALLKNWIMEYSNSLSIC